MIFAAFLFFIRKQDVCLHYRKHGAHIVIQLPWDPGGLGGDLRILSPVRVNPLIQVS